MTAVLTDRFWSKVRKTDACWLWLAGTNGDGYPTFYYQGKKMLAHRVSFVEHGGAISEGEELDHLCRTPLCVNPKHLEPVTHRENMRRSETPVAENMKKAHCDQGHPLSGPNLKVRSDGRRRCLACQRAHDAARAPRPRSER